MLSVTQPFSLILHYFNYFYYMHLWLVNISILILVQKIYMCYTKRDKYLRAHASKIKQLGHLKVFYFHKNKNKTYIYFYFRFRKTSCTKASKIRKEHWGPAQLRINMHYLSWYIQLNSYYLMEFKIYFLILYLPLPDLPSWCVWILPKVKEKIISLPSRSGDICICQQMCAIVYCLSSKYHLTNRY